MIVYVAHVVTDSSDHYIWVFAQKPTRAQVIQRLFEMEGAEDLDWYEDTTSVTIIKETVIE